MGNETQSSESSLTNQAGWQHVEKHINPLK